MAVRKTAAGARLKRWFKEKWRTPSGKKDYSGGENTFRPTRRITKDTPTTWSELTPAEKARAQREKNTKGRVSRYKRKGDRKLRKAAKAASKGRMNKANRKVRKAFKKYNKAGGGFLLPGPAEI